MFIIQSSVRINFLASTMRILGYWLWALIGSEIFPTTTEALPYLRSKYWHGTLSKLLKDMLNNHLPRCELVLIQDIYFSHTMNRWLMDLSYPYYSITMGKMSLEGFKRQKYSERAAGFTCSTIIAVCLTFSTCRTSDAQIVYKMMHGYGMLLSQRRTLLYIDDQRVGDAHLYKIINDSVPLRFSALPVSYQEQDTDSFTLPVMNLAVEVVRELASHITLIRRLDAVNDSVWSLVHKRTVFYETTTFTPNWLPGGTPVLRNIWSTEQGFTFKSSMDLDLKYIRPGGKVRFCASSMDILPMLYVKPGQPPRGIDGEMLKIFQRRFKIQMEVFETNKSISSDEESIRNLTTGVMGYLVRKEADFGIGRLAFTSAGFVSGLKYTPSFVVISAVAVCPVPKLLPRFNTLIQPFDQTTWMYLGITTVLTVLATQFLQRITVALNLDRERQTQINVYVPWIQMVGPVLQKSITLDKLSRRLAVIGLTGLWLHTTLIMSCSYKSVLIGSLTFPPRESYVVSPYDLVKRKLKFTISPLVSKMIRNSVLADEKQMYKMAVDLNEDPSYKEPPDLKVYAYVRRTRNCAVAEKLRTNYIVGQISDTSSNFTQRFPRLYTSRDTILLGPTGWAMRSDVDFLLENYFDTVFIQFRANGIFAKTMSDFDQWGGDTTDEDDSNEFHALSYDTIEPVLWIAYGGLGISLLVFLCEVLFHAVMSHLRPPSVVLDPNVIP